MLMATESPSKVPRVDWTIMAVIESEWIKLGLS
jgi:hypothetical protein